MDIGPDLRMIINTQSSDAPVSEVSVLQGRIPDEDYYGLLESLNVKQQMILKHILKCVKTKDEPLHLFVTGGAGVGKSVLINTIYQSLQRYLGSKEGEDPENTRILLCAPTGTAAYNIRGLTNHKAFNIRVYQSIKNTSDQNILSAANLNTLRTLYRDLQFVIIDEISMVGNHMFKLINERLQQIKGNNKVFGGVHMLLVGDLFQLEAIRDGMIFETLSTRVLATVLWETFTMMELTTIMRQRDDLEFAHLLNRLREGCHTMQDIELLETRLVDWEDESVSDITHLYYQKDAAKARNTEVYNSAKGEKKTVEAIDSILGDLQPKVKARCFAAISTDPSETGGLHKQLLLAVGLRYELTTNIDVNDGLTNGAQCYLKYIDYQHSPNPSSTPSILWVVFDHNDIGIAARGKNRQYYSSSSIQHSWTPIFAIKRQFALFPHFVNVKAVRNQFPLTLSAARTIHKAQGSTMDKVVVTLPNIAKPHLHYVALSRVTSLNGLYIKELNPLKITVREDVKEEIKRLRTKKSENLSYTSPATLPTNCLKIAFLNTRSLHAHIKKVRNDHDLEHMDFIALAETKLKHSDSDHLYKLQNYDINRFDQSEYTGTRPPHGLVLYIRNTITPDIVLIQSDSSPDFEYFYFTYQLNQFIFLYRSPSSSTELFKQKFKTVLDKLDKNFPRLIVGDFNIDASDDKNKSLIKRLEEMSGCKQIVTEPTTNNHTTIDLAFTNIPQMSYSCIESIWSDHKILFSYVNSDCVDSEK